MFRDHRVIGEWLPPTMYVTRYETGAFRPLATFEEDIDVTSGSEPGVTLRGDSLAVWKEDMLQLRSSNRSNTSASQENQAVWLGWNNRIAGTERTGPPASFTLSLPDGLAGDWALDGGTTLDLMLAPTDDEPRPREDPEASEGGNENEEGEGRRPERRGEDVEPPPVDLSVEVEDASGRTARVALSDYGPIRRPLETWISMRRDLERDRFATHWELVLQSYSIPLGDFVSENRALELDRLRAVRLVFDRTEAGEVVVDQIGLSDLHPDFLRARVER